MDLHSLKIMKDQHNKKNLRKAGNGQNVISVILLWAILTECEESHCQR